MRTLSPRPALTLALALSLATTSGAQETTPDPWSDARVAEVVGDLVEEALGKRGAVGFSVAVGWGDRVVLDEGYGIAEAEHGVPAGPETLFRIGSITKQFTAAAVMRLVELGEVELDASIEEYLPEFSTQGHTVTVRQLLTHTSGIQSYTDLGRKWRETVALELSHEQMLELFEDEPFEFEPGERFKYNNSGYYLLGMLIENVTGADYDELLEQEFFEPLGLSRTRYDSNGDLIEDRAQGYQILISKLRNDFLIGMSQPGGAGALISTAGDLIRWQQALVRGDVVSAESYAAMTTPHTLPDGSTTGYGFGLSIGEDDGRARIGHGGGIFGFNSMLGWYPEVGLAVAVISNSEAASSGQLAARIAKALLAGPSEPAPDSEPAEATAGAVPSVRRFDSPRIERLAAEVEDDPAALDAFWEEVDGATPLVEPCPEVDGAVWLTYLWRGDEDTTEVWMHGGVNVGREKRLHLLRGTNVWYRTEVTPDDSRFTYGFLLDPVTSTPRDMKETLAHFAASPRHADPFNPATFGPSSVVELPNAPEQSWIEPREGVARGVVTSASVPSEILGHERSLSVYTPPGHDVDGPPCGLLVVFDGEVYGGSEDWSLVPTPTILDNLIAEGRIGPTVALLVHSLGQEARTHDLSCSEDFADFLAKELVPWARERYGVTTDPAHTVVAGSSLGGLMSTFTALRHPGVFGKVLSQSGSYWVEREWMDDMLRPRPRSSGWLVEHVLAVETRPIHLFMEVGTFEGDGAMVGTNRHLRDVLRAKGYEVDYSEFHGGHDYLCWRGSLADGLLALVGTER